MGKDKKDASSSSKSKSAKQKDSLEKHPLLPPGLANHTNTCFFNGTLQSLIATQLLEDTVSFRSVPTFHKPSSVIPIAPNRSPALTNARGGPYEREWVSSMPISDAFLMFMRRAWQVRDSRSRVALSPRELLSRVGDKYSQYLDFRQQDAHELLRHLLDGMRMEELDVIKKRQPPPQQRKKTSGPGQIQDPTLSTAGSRPEDPNDPALSPIKEEEQLHSFVDMIFGGKLASILVCESCKHISHTYEDFNDLSLSLKPEEKGSKRDRLKHLAQKLIKGGPTPPTSSPPLAPSIPPMLHPPTEAPSLVISPASLASPIPVHPHSLSRPALLASETPRAQSVPPQLSLSNTPLKQLVEAAPSDINRRRSDELLRRSAEQEPPSPPIAAQTATIALSEPPDPSAAHNTSNETPAEKSPSEGLGTRIGRRVSRTFGIKGKDKHRDKSKDQDASANDDAHTEDDGEKRGREEGRTSGEFKRNNSSKRASIFSLTPSISREPSPQRSQFDTSITAKKHSKRSAAQLAAKEKLTRQKERAKRKARRVAAEAAYLRSVLRDDPYGMNPLWKLAASSLPNSSSASVASVASASAAQLSGQTLWNKLGGAPGIVECLRQFTAVEALDGDNSFACKHCWKRANPNLVKRRRRKAGDQKSNDTPAADSGDDGSTSSSCYSSGSESEDELFEKPSTPILMARKGDLHAIPSPNSRPITPLPPVAVPLRKWSDISTEDEDTANSEWSIIERPSIVDLSSSKPSPAERPSTPLFLATPTQESTPGSFAGQMIPAISTTSPEGPSPMLTSTSSPRLKPLADGGLLSPIFSRDEHRGAKKISAPGKGGFSSDGESSASSGESEMDGQEGDSMTSFTTGSDGGTAPKPRVKPSSSAGPPVKLPPRSQRVIHRRALKRYLIATPPPVLVIHLKRFQQVVKGSVTLFGNFKKLDDYVSFPEYLDLSGFIAPRREDFGLKKRHKHKKGGTGPHEAKDREGVSKQEWWRFGADLPVKHEESKVVYRLYAVVVHIGSMLGGHYVAYTALPPAPSMDVKPTPSTSSNAQPANDQPSDPDVPKSKSSPKPAASEERQWCFVSDMVVRAATLDEVLRAKAYLCFYERIQ